MKDKIKVLFSDLKNNMSNYKFSYFMLAIMCIYLIISNHIDKLFIGEQVLYSILFIFVSIFACESIKVDKKIYFIGVVISILLGIYIKCYSIDRLAIAYTSIIILYSLYKIYKNSNLKLGDYLIKVDMYFLKYFLIYIILDFGINFVLLIFSNLIVELDFKIFLDVQYIMLLLCLIPIAIISLNNKCDVITSYIKKLIKNILIPLYFILTIIIYIYAIKVITIGFPSNQVFAIITLIYVYSLYIWCVKDSVELKYLDKYKSFLPYTFIVPLIIQIISITLRIANYGLTTTRYIGIIFIIIEVISLVLTYLKKDLAKLIYSLIIILFIGLCVPIINVEELPVLSQIDRFKTILNKDFDKLDRKSKVELHDIVNYLSDSTYGTLKLKKIVDDETLTDIHEYPYYNNVGEEKYFDFTDKNKKIDVSSYNYMKKVDLSDKDKNKKIESAIINMVKENKQNSVINLDDYDLYITSLNCSYTLVDEKYDIKYYYIEGYYLYK